MSENNAGGPAFPVISDGSTYATEPGMMLRDYFAAKALQGQLSQPDDRGYSAPNLLAAHCYRMADAMLRARGDKS